MERLFIIVLTLLSSAVSLRAQITVEECMRLACDNYPQIKELDLITASEKYDLDNASMSWVPQFSVSGKAAWQSEVVEMPFEIPGYDFNMPNDQYSVTGDITQQIWDGGAVKSNKMLIKSEAEVKRSQVEVSVYSVRSRVQNVFLGILLLDEQIKQNSLLEESLRRNLKEVLALMESGMAESSDRDIVQVNILNCEQQKTELQYDRSAYVRMLGLLTGRDMTGEEFVVPSDIQDVDPGIIRRPELDLYAAQLKQNSAQKLLLDSYISPKFNLSLQGGYGRPGLNMLKNGFEPFFVAGLKMQWNFGALYTRKNDLKKIDAAVRNVELERSAFLLNTSIDAVDKQSEIDKAREAIMRDDEIIRLRESIRQAGEEQYRNGTIKMTELMDMIDDEHDARLAKSVHNVKLLLAIYDLKNTLGQ